MIDGVCGGISQYVGVDATLVRLGFVFLAFLGGLGVVLYIAAMIIMPAGNGAPVAPAAREHGNLLGIILVVVGGLLLLGKVGFSFWNGWWNLPWGVVIPVVFIAGGIALIVAAKRERAPGGEAPASGGAPAGVGGKLHRSRTNKKILGVCGGIGEYLNADPTIVRILFVLAALASAGLMVLLYVIMALVVPTEAAPAAPAAPPTSQETTG
jgi:phage shock protein PspC (stress-responsive transcriptional regulator)